MLRFYIEMRFLLRKMREVRRLPEAEVPAWAERTGQEWGYLHQEHY